jgi:hypothetical protein
MGIVAQNRSELAVISAPPADRVFALFYSLWPMILGNADERLVPSKLLWLLTGSKTAVGFSIY